MEFKGSLILHSSKAREINDKAVDKGEHYHVFKWETIQGGWQK